MRLVEVVVAEDVQQRPERLGAHDLGLAGHRRRSPARRSGRRARRRRAPARRRRRACRRRPWRRRSPRPTRSKASASISGPTSVPSASGSPIGTRGVGLGQAVDELVAHRRRGRSAGAGSCSAGRRCRPPRRRCRARPARGRPTGRRRRRCCRRARGSGARSGTATTGATARPIRVEPVADTMATPSWAASAAPTSAPPWSTWLRPSGAPTSAAARRSRASQASAVSGVLSDGFQSTGSPATSASAAFHDHTATGKLNAVMTAHGPIGCHVSISRWPGPLAGDRQAVQLAGQADGEVADVDHLLDLAEALGADLAGLDRHQRAERRPCARGAARRAGARGCRGPAPASCATSANASVAPVDGARRRRRRRRPAPSEPPVIGVRAARSPVGAAAPHAARMRGDALGERRRWSAARRSRPAAERRRGRRRGSPAPMSACSRVTTSGGAMRIDRSPHVSTSRPRSKHARSSGVGGVVVGEVDADHQAAAADLLEQRLVGLQRRAARRAGGRRRRRRWRPGRRSTRSSVASGGGAGDRVAAERRAVAARLPVHDARPGRRCRPAAGRWRGPCRCT